MQINKVTTTSIGVNWNEITEIDRNGNITMYKIRYAPLDTFDGQLSTEHLITTTVSVMEVSLNGLQEYVEYSISVRAYTDVGAGPFSPDVMQRTLEDGE